MKTMTYVKSYINGFINIFMYLSALLIIAASFMYGPGLIVLPLYISAFLGVGYPIADWINKKNL